MMMKSPGEDAFQRLHWESNWHRCTEHKDNDTKQRKDNGQRNTHELAVHSEAWRCALRSMAGFSKGTEEIEPNLGITTRFEGAIGDLAMPYPSSTASMTGARVRAAKLPRDAVPPTASESPKMLVPEFCSEPTIWWMGKRQGLPFVALKTSPRIQP